MKSYINPYAQKIFALLTPLIGEMMASGVLKTQSNKLGTDEESLIQKNLPSLADGIEKGLKLFLGSESAHLLSNKIRDIK